MGIISRRRARRRGEAVEVDWAALRPRRLNEHERRGSSEEGPLLSLIVPRFRGHRLRRLAQALRIRPYRIHLDAMGSAAWLQCDGERSVGEITARLEELFSGQEQLDDRLRLFFGQLARGGFLELRRVVAGAVPTAEKRG